MNIYHVSTFSPTPCGIATFTEALMQNFSNATHYRLRLFYHCDIVENGADHILKVEDRASYIRAAQIVSSSDADVVSLQHEFSLFGGIDGEYVLGFVHNLQKPLVVTLHTTPAFLSPHQEAILRSLAERSALVIVLTEQAKHNIAAVAGDKCRVIVIRHGVPEIPFAWPSDSALRRKRNRQHAFVSAGHVSDRKGYTNTLAALKALRSVTDDFEYNIIGTYQPQFTANAQCVYSLKRMIAEFGLQNHVFFHELYAGMDFVFEQVAAADAGIVAYTDCQQSSSGMIPLLLACGRAVIATPFEYAAETAKVMPGIQVCKGYQSHDLLEGLEAIVENKAALMSSMPIVHASMQSWIWPKVAELYRAAFQVAHT